MTPDEWRMKERLEGSQDTEEEWLACPAADCLLGCVLQREMNDRKMRLFGCACCRLVWHNLIHPESRAAIEATERFALGEISAEAMQNAADTALDVVQQDNPPRVTDRGRREEYIEYITALSAGEVACAEDEGGWPYWERLVEIPSHVLQVAKFQRFGLDKEVMEVALCACLRDVFGNPYRQHRMAPEWRTNTVLSLAREIVDGRAFDSLPILADAIEQAGCTEQEIIHHFRNRQTYFLGCWALDLVLGLS